MRRRIASLGALALAAPLVLAACGSSSDSKSGAGDPYRVVVSAAPNAQGALATQSATTIQSAKAAAKDINAHGGIDGRKVQLIQVDDGGDPTKAVTVLREQIAKQKPDLYINAGPGTLAAAVAPVLKSNNILYMNTAPFDGSGDPKKFPLAFDVSILPAQQVEGFVPEIKARGYKSVALIYGNSPTSAVFGDAATKVFKANGVNLVAKEQYDIASLDMTPQLARLKAKKPDALVMNAYGAPVGYLIKSLQKLGWNVPILGDISVSASSLTSTKAPDGIVGTPDAKNLTMLAFKSTVYDPSDTRVNAFVTALKQYGAIKSSLINGWTWDSLQMVAAAAKIEKSSKTADIVKGLETGAKLDDAANTAIVDSRNYSATSHSPVPSKNVFTFTKPSTLYDGQFGNPKAS